MGASVELVNYVPDVVTAGNKVALRFQASNNWMESAGSEAQISLDWGTIPVADYYFDLLLFGQTVRFTCKASPDNSGTQFHDGTGIGSLADWIQVLGEDLLKNYLIARYYNLVAASSTITITAKDTGSAYSLEFTPDENVDVTYYDDLKTGVDEVYRAFYGIVVLLYCNNTFVTELILNVDDEGYAETDVAELLKPYLSQAFEWPEGDSSFIFDCPGAVATWFFYYGERWGSATYKELIKSNTYRVIEAGLSWMYQARCNAPEGEFWTRLTLNKYFLTWAPLSRIIAPDEPVKIYYMNFSAATSLKLMAKLYIGDDDDTITVETVTSADKTIWEFILSPEKVGYTGILDKTLVKFDVWVENEANEIISEVRTYTLDYTNYEHTRYFLFKNSMGCYDCLRTTGLMSKSEEITRETASVSMDYDYTSKDREDISISNLEKQRFVVSVGWMSKFAMPERYRNWLRDFTLSKEVFQVLGTTIVPIRLTGSSFDHGKDRDSIRGFTFEFENAFDNEYFTKEITPQMLDEIYAVDFERMQ